MMNAIHLRRAAKAGLDVLVVNPDPYKAVEMARSTLPKSLRGEVRIGVARPAVVGREARITLTHKRTSVTRTKAVTR